MQLRTWLANLNRDGVRRREEATKALIEAGQAIEAVLRKAQDAKKSLEEL